MMDSLRKPFFFAAAALLGIAVLIETGSALLDSRFDLPGFGIPYLALIDGLLLYLMLLMGAALIVPERLQGRIQGVISLLVSIVVLVLGVVLLIKALLALTLMVSLLLSVPFGTLAYFAGYAEFGRAGAALTLTALMSLKLAFAVCLVLAHPRFLQIKSLVFLILTALLANVIVEFCQAFPPGFLVSIVDAVAALVVAVLALIWGLGFLFQSLPAIGKALRLDR